jgi:hypothetical protein
MADEEIGQIILSGTGSSCWRHCTLNANTYTNTNRQFVSSRDKQVPDHCSVVNESRYPARCYNIKSTSVKNFICIVLHEIDESVLNTTPQPPGVASARPLRNRKNISPCSIPDILRDRDSSAAPVSYCMVQYMDIRLPPRYLSLITCLPHAFKPKLHTS